MSLLAKADITDELINPNVTDTYLNDADAYLLALLQGFDSTLTIDKIKSPLPYAVKQLAVAHVCVKVCQDKFGGQVGIMFKGQDGGDRWYTKLKHYEEIVSQYETSMTQELMTGDASSGRGYYSMPVERG
jgi:hypothetical protein